MLDSMTDNIKKSPEMNKYTKNFTKSSFLTIFTVILLHNSDKIQNIIEQKWLSKTQKLFSLRKHPILLGIVTWMNQRIYENLKHQNLRNLLSRKRRDDRGDNF